MLAATTSQTVFLCWDTIIIVSRQGIQWKNKPSFVKLYVHIFPTKIAFIKIRAFWQCAKVGGIATRKFRECSTRPSCVWTNVLGIHENEPRYSVFRSRWVSFICFQSILRADYSFVYVAFVQLFSNASATSWERLHVYIRPLGASIVIVGLMVLFIGLSSSPRETTSFLFINCSGLTRYFTIQVALTKGVFPVARLATGFVAMMLGVLVTLTFGILLAGKLERK